MLRTGFLILTYTFRWGLIENDRFAWSLTKPTGQPVIDLKRRIVFSWYLLLLDTISQAGPSPTSSYTIIASSMRRVYSHTLCNCLENNCLFDILTCEALHGFENRRVIWDDGANLSYSQLWSVRHTSICELCTEGLTFGSDRASSKTWGVKSIVRKTLFACCCG